MAQRIRVCMIAPLYHPSLGGVGRQAQRLAEKLSSQGVDVTVVARRMKGMPAAFFSPAVPVIRAWSLKPYLHTFEAVTIGNLLVSLSFCLSAAVVLLRRRNEYDIVHFHGASLPLFVNLPILKLLKKPVIAKVAGTLGTEAGALRGRYRGMGKLLLWLLQGVDRFVATTAQIEEGLLNDGFAPDKIVRIPNFIDFGGVDLPARKDPLPLVMSRPGPLVTFAGRFIPCKGIEYLLEAWRVVTREVPEATLLLLGDGPLLPAMQQRVAESHHGSRIIFGGHVENVRQYLEESDVFVLCSLQEGMPNALLEAMAAGLPAVATRIGGVQGMIRDGENGVLVEPADPLSLARGITLLLKDVPYAHKLGKNAEKTIKDNFNLEGVSVKYLELYRKLL